MVALFYMEYKMSPPIGTQVHSCMKNQGFCDWKQEKYEGILVFNKVELLQ